MFVITHVILGCAKKFYSLGGYTQMQYRLIRPEELPQAAALADSVFRKEGDRSMGELFPSIFRPGLVHSYAAWDEDGTLAAFMGLVPSTVQAGPVALRAFSIGSVCTAPAYRNRGLAGTLLALCQKHARRAGAALIFVSGERSLYERAGCVPFGRAARVRLHPEAAASLAAAESDDRLLRPMQPEDLHAVCELLTAREAGFAVSAGELAAELGAGALAGAMGLTPRTLVAVREGRVEGFLAAALPAAVPGAPDDPARGDAAPSDGAAVEWAGRPEAVAALLAKAALCSGAALEVPVPWHEHRLLALLREAGAAAAFGGNAGTVCAASRAELLRQAVPAEADRAAVEAAAPGDRELLSVLFDPDSPLRAAADGLPPALPLPYLYGLHFV